MYDGNAVQERIVAYRPDEMTYRVEVVDHGPFPLEFMDVEISVVALDGARCNVTYSGNFRPKFGPLGWIMGKAVMQGQFVKMLGQVIEGANSHLSTGRIIEKDGALGGQYIAA